MKSKDIIQEGLFSDLSNLARSTTDDIRRNRGKKTGIGSRMKAWFKKGKYGRSTQDQMAADKFVDKFVTRGMEALNLAVKQGLVDPNSNKLSRGPNAAKQQAKGPELAKGVEVDQLDPIMLNFKGATYILGDKGGWVDMKNNQPVQQSFAAFLDKQHNIALQQNQASQQPKGKKRGKSAAGAQGGQAAGGQPAQAGQPQQAAAGSAQPAPAPATANAPAAKTKAAAPKAAAKPAAQPAAAPKAAAKPAAQPAAAPKAAAQPRQTVAQKIAPQLQAKAARKAAGKSRLAIKESQYDKINNIFEEYMLILEAKNKTLSISQYFKDEFLDDFLQGINMAPAKAKIDALLKNLPQLYKSGQIKKALEDIGEIAFTLANKK